MGGPGNISGPKRSPMGNEPMGPGGPPPHAGPGGPSPGGFNKNSPIMQGPTTSDPNYAQQFHDFQQQLYATNTRGSQMRGSAGPGGPLGPGPGGPGGPGGHPGFMPPVSQGNFYAGPPGSGPMPS